MFYVLSTATTTMTKRVNIIIYIVCRIVTIESKLVVSLVYYYYNYNYDYRSLSIDRYDTIHIYKRILIIPELSIS